MSGSSSDSGEGKSPYASPICIIFFGDSKIGYLVHTRFIEKYESLMELFRESQGGIWLNDVHESVAYSFIEYLYSEELCYEASDKHAEDLEVTLRLIYAAGAYDLYGLYSDAHGEMRVMARLAKSSEVLFIAKKMHASFKGQKWFFELIKSTLEFDFRYPDSDLPAIMEQVIDDREEDGDFAKLLIKALTEILIEKSGTNSP
ncbi:hypothetical protein MGYG_05472 [Nannizzia gypsea CBS 118893]|uniref:BTB domain-containing protein n=1 Tax=Arthroderma gypseum (strain ATCC MYA-4604 / CBS 118893) TaxID=535722 RepID=E4UW31_ARTGP|nr:hypothetical protein MGYG_05472 [Nannizzia gypsea CBS 118893]EFR02479.1 hypothetical protein MGYG_05472 [Nannizzia gypsea CBS 118893]